MSEVEVGSDQLLINLTADIVSAHVSNNAVAVDQVPGLIATVFGAIASLGDPVVVAEPLPASAVSVRSSVKPDYIVCLEDGKKLKMLKRHLMTRFGLTPDQYRVRWNLPADYPMVCSNYAEKRRNLAITIGLGRKPAVKVAAKSADKRQAGADSKVRAKKVVAKRVSGGANEASSAG